MIKKEEQAFAWNAEELGLCVNNDRATAMYQSKLLFLRGMQAVRITLEEEAILKSLSLYKQIKVAAKVMDMKDRHLEYAAKKLRKKLHCKDKEALSAFYYQLVQQEVI